MKIYKSIIVASLQLICFCLSAQDKVEEKKQSHHPVPENWPVAIYKENDPVKKEELYQQWLKNFPPTDVQGSKKQYDLAKQSVAIAYATAGNTKKALEYSDGFLDKEWSADGYAGIAFRLLASKDTLAALPLFLKAINISQENNKIHQDQQTIPTADTKLAGLTFFYAGILATQKKYPEALEYLDKSEKASNHSPRAEVKALKAQVLMQQGYHQQALDYFIDLLNSGQGNEKMKKDLEIVYVKVKGSRDGYAQLEADINAKLTEKMRMDVAKKMIHEPAPSFTVKDADGKQVSLSDYKGKVVVLDFWASWCGPCKKSFPAMQIAVNKYTGDKGVHFLFMDTGEKAPDYQEKARKFMKDNQYSFHVVFDALDKQTGQYPVANLYHAKQIPAKFIIDGEGNIRFRVNGFSEGDFAAVAELSEMIESVKSYSKNSNHL